MSEGHTSLSPGEIVAGRYRLRRLVAAGAMGVVWEAEHLESGRAVAVKTLTAKAARAPSAVERFEREARLTARIDHPNVVRVLERARLGDAPLMVVEYLDGETLDDAMAREGRFAVAEVCEWLRPVAAALDATHAAGVLHRDVKPANVVRARGADGDRVKLIDFGLAVVEDAPADMRLTGAGTFVGTPAYLAPEVATGEAVDARCDVYSLACVAYEMLTGRAPHARETTMATLTAKLTEPAPAPSSVLGDGAPAGLDPLFARALSIDPDERPASAAAFVRELVRVAEGRARRPAPTLPPAPKAAPARRKPTGLWLALTATIATVLCALWMTGPDAPRAFAERPAKERPAKLET